MPGVAVVLSVLSALSLALPHAVTRNTDAEKAAMINFFMISEFVC